MIPTGKKAKCEGIRNRMRKCQGHPKVEEVVGRMSYKQTAKCPDGLITYSLMDLNDDILQLDLFCLVRSDLIMNTVRRVGVP